MGYQESLIYIQPQEQVGQIVKEYLMARQQAPSGRFLADIPSTASVATRRISSSSSSDSFTYTKPRVTISGGHSSW